MQLSGGQEDTATAPPHSDDDARLRRLGQFLRWITAAAFAFGIAEAGVALVFGEPVFAGTAGLTIGYGMVALYAARAARQNQAARSVLVSGLGLMAVAVASAALVPEAAPGLALLPSVAAVLAMQFVGRESIWWLLVLSWLVTVAIATAAVVATSLYPAEPVLAGPVAVAATGAASGLLLLLIWQLWRHLTTVAAEKARLYGMADRELRHREGAERDLVQLADERALVADAMTRLDSGASPEVIARTICAESLRLEGVDGAALFVLGRGGPPVPLAAEGAAGAALVAARDSSADGRRLRQQAATGAWMEPPEPSATNAAPAVTAVAYAPVRYEGRLLGVLAFGSDSVDHVPILPRRMVTLVEFASMAGAFLGPPLRSRRREATLRRQLQRIIDTRAFTAVFQPIVDMSSGRPVGYEALTRFSDGVPPAVRFAQAQAVDLGEALEVACLELAIAESRTLPPDAWLSVNASADLLDAGASLEVVLARTEREVVIEITEETAIADYARLRAAFNALRPGVRLAVDDAGAGYAGLRQIVELRPSFLKLDRELVRSVDRDPVRQAMVAGLRHFALQTGCELIAEGVEEDAERVTLEGLGIRLGQGFLWAKPLPIGQLKDRSRRGRSARARRPSTPHSEAVSTATDMPLVLVVDDNASMRTLAERALGELDCQIVTATDGVDGLRKLRSLTSLAVLVTDVLMPGLNGPELAQSARSIFPGVKVIFATGLTSERLGSLLDDDQGVILSKPVSVRKLQSAVRVALAEHGSIGPRPLRVVRSA